MLERMAGKTQKLKALLSNSERDYELFLNKEDNHEFRNFLKCLILSFSSTSYSPEPSAESDIIYPAIKEGRLIKQSMKALY